ncbi:MULTISPECIES: hypothetical protein [unclassified Microbacterium]|uniref:hypothetical protein n=1 Tax=unclassified Microbacterium TaxID=2609290 RepID=UPI000A76CB8F|nr:MULTISPECIES: hypothetical protein [unclassified Microbacterium]
MAKRLTAGRNEVGVLCDIRETAQRVGEEVRGFPTGRFVEGEQAKNAKRPDVIIAQADGNPEVTASGEAKRPETERLT